MAEGGQLFGQYDRVLRVLERRLGADEVRGGRLVRGRMVVVRVPR